MALMAQVFMSTLNFLTFTQNQIWYVTKDQSLFAATHTK